MGAMLSLGGLYFSDTRNAITALAFAHFLSQLLQPISKLLVMAVDNASIQTAKAVHPLLQLLEFQRLTLYSLPPHSPELNLIEILWHKIKYEWLPFANIYEQSRSGYSTVFRPDSARIT